MKITVGRDPASGRFKVSVDGGKMQTIKGTEGFSAMVSKDHLLLETEDGTNFLITNLKDTNVTYIGGVPVKRYHVRKGDGIYLGVERQRLDWNLLEPYMPKYVDIRPLKMVWEGYNQQMMELNIERSKAMQKRMLLPAITMSGSVIATIIPLILPDVPDKVKAIIPAVALLIGIMLTIYFFIKGNKDAERYPQMIENLKDTFRKAYVCPNPQCRHHFGQVHYDQLSSGGACPKCRAKFIK